MYSKNGGNQNVTCSTVESVYLKTNLLAKAQEPLHIYTGKDLDNRFYSNINPGCAGTGHICAVGRSGASNQSVSVKQRGAAIQYFTENPPAFPTVYFPDYVVETDSTGL